MTATSWGPKNEPEFADGDAPDVALNPKQAAAYAGKVGNRRTGTDAERDAATGKDVWEGLAWGSTTDGSEYKRVGGAWELTWSRDTGWTTLTPAGNWTVISPVRWRRRDGIVFLRGIVSRTTGADAIITLPVGARPSVIAVHPMGTTSVNGSMRATVTTAGVVSQGPFDSGTYMYLDGVSFIAEQ